MLTAVTDSTSSTNSRRALTIASAALLVCSTALFTYAVIRDSHERAQRAEDDLLLQHYQYEQSQFAPSLAGMAGPTLGGGVNGQGNITMNCLFNSGGVNWDLSAFTSPDPAVFYRTQDLAFGQGYWYLIKICGNLICKPGIEAAVCQTQAYNVGNPSHQVGFYENPPNGINGYWDFINPNQPGYGLKMILANGDYCPGQVPRTAHIFFDCDPNAAPAPSNLTNTFTVNALQNCVYEYRIKTNQTCVAGFIPPTVPPAPATVIKSSTGAAPKPASTGGNKPTSTGTFRPSSTGPAGNSTSSGDDLFQYSAGTWFCIGVAGVSFVYVLFGCIHRRVSYGVVGFDACPNYPFWSELPGLLADGFRWTWYKIRCREVPARGYKSVK